MGQARPRTQGPLMSHQAATVASTPAPGKWGPLALTFQFWNSRCPHSAGRALKSILRMKDSRARLMSPPRQSDLPLEAKRVTFQLERGHQVNLTYELLSRHTKDSSGIQAECGGCFMWDPTPGTWPLREGGWLPRVTASFLPCWFTDGCVNICRGLTLCRALGWVWGHKGAQTWSPCSPIRTQEIHTRTWKNYSWGLWRKQTRYVTEKNWGMAVAPRMVREGFFKEETEDEKVLGRKKGRGPRCSHFSSLQGPVTLQLFSLKRHSLFPHLEPGLGHGLAVAIAFRRPDLHWGLKTCLPESTFPWTPAFTPSKPAGEVGKRHMDESQVVSAFVAKARLDQSLALESPSHKGTQPRSAGPLPNPPLTRDAWKAQPRSTKP